MTVGVLVLDVIIPASTSLKEKRLVIKSLKDRVKRKFNVSVAETGFLDKWQRSEIGIAVISNSPAHAEESLSNVFNFIDVADQYEIVSYKFEYY
jgi:uncharacterized protein YlxP (DUF503 family)